MNLTIAETDNYHDDRWNEIESFLSGTYWEQSVWNIDNPFFKEEGFWDPECI